MEPVHLPLQLLHRLLASSPVIDNPLRETDGAGHLQTAIAQALAEVLQTAAVLDMLLDLKDPRLDRLIPGPRGDLDFLDKLPFLPVDRAGIQAVAKRFAVSLLLRRGRSGSGGQTG